MRDEALDDVRRITRRYERLFRLRLFEADTAEDQRAARYGLRHAVGFRVSAERLADPAVKVKT